MKDKKESLWFNFVLFIIFLIVVLTVNAFELMGHIDSETEQITHITIGFLLLTIYIFVRMIKNGDQNAYFVVLLPIFLVFGIYFKEFHGKLSHDSAHWANFASYFNGLAGPLLSFVTIILLIQQLKHTSVQLEHSTKVLELTIEKYRRERSKEIRSNQPVFKSTTFPNDFIFEKSSKEYVLSIRNDGVDCSDLEIKFKDQSKSFKELKSSLNIECPLFVDIDDSESKLYHINCGELEIRYIDDFLIPQIKFFWISLVVAGPYTNGYKCLFKLEYNKSKENINTEYIVPKRA